MLQMEVESGKWNVFWKFPNSLPHSILPIFFKDKYFGPLVTHQPHTHIISLNTPVAVCKTSDQNFGHPCPNCPEPEKQLGDLVKFTNADS